MILTCRQLHRVCKRSNLVLGIVIICMVCVFNIGKSWLEAINNDRILFGNFSSAPLPHSSKGAVIRKTEEYDGTNNEHSLTMGACLLIRDDSIKLTEWIAYHYTILPLSNLVVAIDPNSYKTDEMKSILNNWISPRFGMNVTIWTDDAWIEAGPDEWWPTTNIQQKFSPPPIDHPQYEFLAHVRRQNLFAFSCMHELKRQKVDWAINMDTDEFLVFNYIHDEIEDWNSYDSRFDQWRTIEDIDQARKENKPIRENLPILGSETVASVLKVLKKTCYHIPLLPISADESAIADKSRAVPSVINPDHLMTLRHRKHGKTTGSSTRIFIDLSRIPLDDIQIKSIRSIRNPRLQMCGSEISAESDYLASPFRINHYVGTRESFLERKLDALQNRHEIFWTAKNDAIHADRDDDDIRPWISAFVDKVGEDNAEFLLHSLEEAYDIS